MASGVNVVTMIVEFLIENGIEKSMSPNLYALIYLSVACRLNHIWSHSHLLCKSRPSGVSISVRGLQGNCDWLLVAVCGEVE